MKIVVRTYEDGTEIQGWDPNQLGTDDYDSPRAAALYAALGSPGPVDEELVLAEAQDGSGRWALLGLSIRGHEYAVEEEEYEYEYPSALPEGWSVAVYPDGTAVLCSPGTCPEELGGRAAAVATVEDAVEGARAVLAVEEE